MITTTTPSIDGRRITAYHGVITGETIIGANIFRDLFAGIRDIVGGRSGAYEKVLAEARDERNPLLERLKYVAICGSNLDEFFMVRVAGVHRQIAAGVQTPSPDGLLPRETLKLVREQTHPALRQLLAQAAQGNRAQRRRRSKRRH